MPTLVITSGSMIKGKERAKAKDLYKGTIFRKVRELCEKKGYDYVIISPKYGLISPEETISPYPIIKISTSPSRKEEFQEVKEKAISKLKEILPKYDKILVVAGEFYRDLLQEVWDERFVQVRSSGYGDMMRRLNRMIKE